MMRLLLAFFLLGIAVTANAADNPLNAPAYHDTAPRRYDLAQRASQIDPRTREHPEINFLFTDKAGKVLDLEHATVDTRVAPRGRLVIWLMGHNPGLFERIASYGLHGIQVHYANGWFAGMGEKIQTDGQSLGPIRLEAATGEDYSPLVDIPKPDGMMERALQFVKWLARENPQGRWDQFLTEGGQGLRWEKVIISGISHGASTAARFAIYQRVDRVVMFSGPRDNYETWQALPSATPPNRFFGFSHVLDLGWTADHYPRSWRMLGLSRFGPVVTVDKTQPPYDHTRQLVTNNDVQNNPNRAHTTVVPGGTAVKNAAGEYQHEAVWRYLFTQPINGK